MALGPGSSKAVFIMSASSSSSLGGHQNDLGNAAQESDVEEAVMGGAVVAGEAARSMQRTTGNFCRQTS
jgi:hypothetical protein